MITVDAKVSLIYKFAFCSSIVSGGKSHFILHHAAISDICTFSSDEYVCKDNPPSSDNVGGSVMSDNCSH